jgi:hypothetical protein
MTGLNYFIQNINLKSYNNLKMNPKDTFISVCSEILKTKVELDQSFIELGGESFEASQISGKLNIIFKTKLKVNHFLKYEYFDKILDEFLGQIECLKE